MIDYAKITVAGGKGGNGAGSFRRVKGKRCMLNKRGVGLGGFLFLKVPVGTVIEVENAGPVTTFLPASAPLTSFEINSSKNGEKFTSSGNEKRAVGIPSSRATRPIEIYDLTQERQKTLIAKGGEGGKGNAKLRDEFRRRPKAGERGGVGEACDITLELKLIADVGLIGLPNAGKSTLLAALTSAKPQIASYPFTTLEPNLGVLDGSQFTVHSSRKGRKEISETVNSEPTTVDKPAPLVLADIPGLIEGAAEGRGLGDLFLKHIQRTKILVHLIDVSTPSEKWSDYQIIRQELKTYSKELVKKKEIVVLNKIDLVDPVKVQKIKQMFAKKRKRVFTISAQKKQGLEELAREIESRL